MTENASASGKDIIKGLLALAAVVAVVIVAVIALMHFISPLAIAIGEAFSGTDVAIMVALITGTISIASVVAGAIVKARIEYSQRKKEYLTQRRIEPYEKLVSIIYKIQMNIARQSVRDSTRHRCAAP